MRRKGAGAMHRAERRPGGRAVAVGVPSALDREADPQIFLPFDQAPIGSMAVILRSSADPSAVIASGFGRPSAVWP